MNKGRTLRLPIYDITIRLTEDGKSGTIESRLKENVSEGADDFNAAIDAVESLILAHAIEGVDVESTPYLKGLQTALDAIGNLLAE